MQAVPAMPGSRQAELGGEGPKPLPRAQHPPTTQLLRDQRRVGGSGALAAVLSSGHVHQTLLLSQWMRAGWGGQCGKDVRACARVCVHVCACLCVQQEQLRVGVA